VSGRAAIAPKGIGTALGALALLAAAGAPGRSSASPAAAPARLSGTGLYADVASRAIAPGVLPFSPQYPLWSDGAAKRRWVRLPPGASIDGSDPDAWRFPAGTRFWKEFSLAGRPVETRYMERRADGRWIYATYLWAPDGRDATLAPERGRRAFVESRPGVPYDIPGTADCRACHQGHPSEVLGFTALQLSPDRDPLAPHAVAPEPGSIDLAGLASRRLLRGFPPRLLSHPPRIEAPSPQARAALGYLQGNCAGCHNARGPLSDLGFSLEERLGVSGASAAVLRTAVRRPSVFRPGGVPAVRLVPGDPAASLLVLRMGSRNPYLQMPPLGTHLVDEEAIALLSAFVREDLADPHAIATLYP
jgi:mono/diheme cytochrome c family protein